MSTSTTGAAPEAGRRVGATDSAVRGCGEHPGEPRLPGQAAILGKPLVNAQLHGEKLSKPIALGVLAPDCITSTAYGTEQMLTQLIRPSAWPSRWSCRSPA